MYTRDYSKQALSCFASYSVLDVKGTDVIISSLAYDSRKVVPGALFFALPGLHADGASFIPAAIENGARAIVHDIDLSEYIPSILYIKVADSRTAMSAAAAAFFNHPSKKLVVIGVTGTEGKSSTVSFIYQLLTACGKKAGFFSTVEYSLGGAVSANPEHQTTPEATTVHEKLAAMVENDCEYAVVESSSHGLSPRTARLADVYFDVGVFMNVTQEHLEFHGTFEQYRFDKAHLFRALDSHDHIKAGRLIPSFGVVNYNDPSAGYFAEATDKPVYAFSDTVSCFESLAVAGGLTASAICEDSRGISCTITDVNSTMQYKAHIPLAGKFNVQNVLAALLTVSQCTQLSPADIIASFSHLTPIKGRMQLIDEGQPFEVLIDYAHTPSSFQTIFPPIFDRVKYNGGHIIAVFGSGGERDTQKRPEQGRIAATFSDIVILTDEDPRGEDSVALLEMIAAGCPHKKRGEDLFIIPDRPSAIKKAFSCARAGDVVLLLGKGHENSIIFKDRTVPYDEETEARNALRQCNSGAL